MGAFGVGGQDAAMGMTRNYETRANNWSTSPKTRTENRVGKVKGERAKPA